MCFFMRAGHILTQETDPSEWRTAVTLSLAVSRLREERLTRGGRLEVVWLG